MKQYLLALSLALIGQAKAEEPKPAKPKDCLDNIVLNIQVKESEKINLFDFYYNTETTEGKERIVQELLAPVQQLYGELGISIESGYVGSEPQGEGRKYESISVVIANNADINEELRPDLKTYLQWAERNGFATKYAEKILSEIPQESRRARRWEQKYVKQQGVFDHSGIADSALWKVYIDDPLFHSIEREAFIEKWLPYYAMVFNHEMGHVFGIEHTRTRVLPNGKFNLLSKKDVFEGVNNYDLSPEDKATIRQQVCKAEQ